jgi:hypothetical protein
VADGKAWNYYRVINCGSFSTAKMPSLHFDFYTSAGGDTEEFILEPAEYKVMLRSVIGNICVFGVLPIQH